MNRIVHLILALGAVGLLAILLALTVSVQPSAHAAGNIIKVPDDYATIQAAIDAATEGDEIWVAKGVYTENLSINKGIALYGGWNISFTLQTPGDSTVNGNNVGRVISITCATSDTVVTVDGFTVVGGDASGLGLPTVPEPPVSDPGPERAETAPATQSPDPRTPSERAAELRVRLADLLARGLYPGGQAAYQATLARLERLTARAEEARARANAASAPSQAQSKQGSGTGGGIYSENASLQLLNCTIGGNVASQDTLGVGGGVFVADAPPSGVRIANNYVSENVACLYGEGWGGGLYVVNAPGAIIGNNVVAGNVASNDGNGYGGGLYVYESPGVVIQDNQFLQNLGSDAGYSSEGMGGGLGVDSSPDAVVRHNLVEGNTASAAWNAYRGIGGGLFLTSSNGAVVRDNEIRKNLALLYGQQGRGGGVQFVWSNYALVADNEVTGNLAALFSADAQGGGIKVAAVYSTTLSGNEIRENAACVYGDVEDGFGLFGGGVYGTAYEHSRLSDNAITANATCYYCGDAGGFGGGVFIGSSQDAVAAGNTIADNAGALLDGVGIGGGLHLRDTTGSQVLRNRILGNRGGVADDSSGGGLVLDRLEGITEQANVDGNLILNNQASGDPTAVSRDGGCSVDGMLGGFSFTNNVVAGNQAAYVGGVSLWSLPQGGTVVNNTIANNGDIGVLVTGSTLTLTNNIVVSHTVGISVTEGATATVSYTLWHGNDTDITGTGTFTHTHPVTGSPAFVNPAADDYHLTLASAARDRGDPAGVPPAPDHDADGVSRPQGPAVDLGAYEWRGHWWYLTLVTKRYLIEGGER
ncbi:MAG: hypothetical protein FJZ89_09220, partial [Chloroflexi bacterium]|nr:hypothetical protein [Chloroflexota bacterium]